MDWRIVQLETLYIKIMNKARGAVGSYLTAPFLSNLIITVLKIEKIIFFIS